MRTFIRRLKKQKITNGVGFLRVSFLPFCGFKDGTKRDDCHYIEGRMNNTTAVRNVIVGKKRGGGSFCCRLRRMDWVQGIPPPRVCSIFREIELRRIKRTFMSKKKVTQKHKVHKERERRRRKK